MPSFSRGLEKALHNAMNLAREHAHEMATLEHLLLALTEDDDAIAVLDACEVDREALRQDLEDFIEVELSSLVVDGDVDATPDSCVSTRYSARSHSRAGRLAAMKWTGANVLVAIFAERESHAAYFLEQQDMTRLDAVNYISHGITKSGITETRPIRGAEEGEQGAEGWRFVAA